MKNETKDELRAKVLRLEIENKALQQQNETLKKQVAGGHFAFMLTLNHAKEVGLLSHVQLCMAAMMFLRNLRNYGHFDIIGEPEALEVFCETAGFDQTIAYSLRNSAKVYDRVLATAKGGTMRNLPERQRMER